MCFVTNITNTTKESNQHSKQDGEALDEHDYV